jgi:hypothetical protein
MALSSKLKCEGVRGELKERKKEGKKNCTCGQTWGAEERKRNELLLTVTIIVSNVDHLQAVNCAYHHALSRSFV